MAEEIITSSSSLSLRNRDQKVADIKPQYIKADRQMASNALFVKPENLKPQCRDVGNHKKILSCFVSVREPQDSRLIEMLSKNLHADRKLPFGFSARY
jgi:hypothetical protein